jgi:nucleoid-associated protein YgaU
MNLTGIIAISGRPGLYKVIAQGKNNIIVESLIDNKRFPAYATDKISALDDISIYTYDEDAPLKDLLAAIYKKEDGKMCPSHKESLTVLQNYLLELLPNYDQERVYSSDVKKMFQWYNLLHKSGNLKMEEAAAEATEIVEEVTQSETATKKPTAKKVAAPKAATAVKAKTADKAKSAKPAAGKKVAAPKTSSNRGK